MKKLSGARGTIRLLLICAILTVPLAFSKTFFNTEELSFFNVVLGSPEKKQAVYSVETDDKKIAVTFDSAWSADDTEELLRILKEHDVKATFFLSGYWIEKYPDKAEKIHKEGHEIGNLSDTHTHVSNLDLEKNKAEIIGAHNKARNLLGIEMNIYRPPYGEYTNVVIEAAETLGYLTVLWSVDSLDWKSIGKDEEIEQVLNNENLKNGSIILFHIDAKYTPGSLEPIITGLKEKGYSIVTVSELIGE